MRYLHLATLILVLLPFGVWAADPDVTHIVFRPIAKELKPGSFAASARHLWRAGDSFLRIEEAPDPAQRIHGVIITNAPHSWLWNRYDNTARHVVDKGPTYNVIVPLYPWVESKDLKQLQMGREVAFFKKHSAKQLADTSIDGVPVAGQTLERDGYEVTMFTRKDTGKPFQLVIIGKEGVLTMRYDLFEEGLPFDRELFVLPEGVKSLDAE